MSKGGEEARFLTTFHRTVSDQSELNQTTLSQNLEKAQLKALDDCAAALQSIVDLHEIVIATNHPTPGNVRIAREDLWDAIANLARNAAVEFNHPAAFFSLEMTSMELTDRLIATESGISSDKIKGKVKLEPYEWQVLEKSVGKIFKAPLYIDETPGITLTEFVAKAKRLVREKGVEIIFVDYLQLMHSGKPQTGGFSKVQEVTGISNTLKNTAKELNVPIIALAQLNRNLMSRMNGSNGKPVLSDLKDSGSIEQDADIVVFLHRPGLIGLADDPEEQAKTEVIFAKNRNGQAGSVNMRYVGHLMKFEDEHHSLYESAMNNSIVHIPVEHSIGYNPFDEFTERDFTL